MQLFCLYWTLVSERKPGEEVDGVFCEILKRTSGSSHKLWFFIISYFTTKYMAFLIPASPNMKAIFNLFWGQSVFLFYCWDMGPCLVHK